MRDFLLFDVVVAELREARGQGEASIQVGDATPQFDCLEIVPFPVSKVTADVECCRSMFV